MLRTESVKLFLFRVVHHVDRANLYCDQAWWRPTGPCRQDYQTVRAERLQTRCNEIVQTWQGTSREALRRSFIQGRLKLYLFMCHASVWTCSIQTASWLLIDLYHFYISKFPCYALKRPSILLELWTVFSAGIGRKPNSTVFGRILYSTS